jgi:hypothetical protein
MENARLRRRLKDFKNKNKQGLDCGAVLILEIRPELQ